MRLRIEVRDLGAIASLERLQEVLGDLSAPLDEAGVFMERETRLNFVSQTTPDGAGWAGLRPATLRRKKTRAILRETSTLMGGIQKQAATASSVQVTSTGAKYGIFHQTGTSKMEQREYIGIGDRHIPRIKQIFDGYIQRAL
ncbi:phage virion morphogenesis protein [Leptolyngbya sp. AN02str]|uniref:phage virion morphogenesis protein n=1 Tax=Leptolyngbya sp. AN02str TaxID=3423363 RepID=UPI003D31BE0C